MKKPMGRTFALLLCAALLMGSSPSRLSAQPLDKTFDLEAGLVLRAYEAMVEEHLIGVVNGLKAIAATQEGLSGDWKRLRGPLAQFGKAVATSAAVWFARPDGSYFTVDKGLSSRNLKDRPYFPGLMLGNDVDGTLIESRSTGARAIVVATPIVKDGHVIGALGVSLSAAKLAIVVNDKIRFPDDVVFYALDTQGQTALHKDTSLIFQFPSDIGDKSLKSAVKEMLSAPEGAVRYTFRGMHRTVIFKASKVTRWVFALGATHAAKPR